MNVEENKYEQEILNKLFELDKNKLKEKIRDIVGSHFNPFVENGTIIKESTNDIPTKITISYYDSYVIDRNGIYYNPEIGVSKLVRKFDKYFKYE